MQQTRVVNTNCNCTHGLDAHGAEGCEGMVTCYELPGLAEIAPCSCQRTVYELRLMELERRAVRDGQTSYPTPEVGSLLVTHTSAGFTYRVGNQHWLPLTRNVAIEALEGAHPACSARNPGGYR